MPVWGKGKAGGGAGATRPEVPRRRAPTPLPAGLPLGRRTPGCAAAAGVLSTRPKATPGGGGGVRGGSASSLKK